MNTNNGLPLNFLNSFYLSSCLSWPTFAWVIADGCVPRYGGLGHPPARPAWREQAQGGRLGQLTGHHCLLLAQAPRGLARPACLGAPGLMARPAGLLAPGLMARPAGLLAPGLVARPAGLLAPGLVTRPASLLSRLCRGQLPYSSCK